MTGDPELRSPTVERTRLAGREPRRGARGAARAPSARSSREGDAVAEGRDVGAVVWPEAELKVWLDADAATCARAAACDELGDASAAAALAERDRARRGADACARPTRSLIDSTELELRRGRRRASSSWRGSAAR